MLNYFLFKSKRSLKTQQDSCRVVAGILNICKIQTLYSSEMLNWKRLLRNHYSPKKMPMCVKQKAKILFDENAKKTATTLDKQAHTFQSHPKLNIDPSLRLLRLTALLLVASFKGRNKFWKTHSKKYYFLQVAETYVSNQLV